MGISMFNCRNMQFLDQEQIIAFSITQILAAMNDW